MRIKVSHRLPIAFLMMALVLISIHLFLEVPVIHSFGQWIVRTMLVMMFFWWCLERPVRDTLDLMGLRWKGRYIAVGFTVGASATVLVWWMCNWGTLRLLSFLFLIPMVLFAPLVEEALFRGFLANPQLYSSKTSWVFACVASTVVFAWLHPENPEEKLVFGTVFLSAYVLTRNLCTSVAAHAGSNATLWLLASYAYGPLVFSIIVLLVTLVSVFLLVILKNICQITCALSRLPNLRKFLHGKKKIGRAEKKQAKGRPAG